MSKKYISPSVTISPYPYVGIIKSYDKTRKYGYIMVLYKRDVFFHIRNSFVKDPRVNMFVAFKVRKSTITGKVEAYALNTISNYKDELLTHQENLLHSDISILYYCQPQLIVNELHKKLKNEYDILNNVDDYIDSIDIQEVIDSYSVEVVTGHIYKPGDDDVAWVCYRGDRKIKNIQDIYIDSILPIFREEIFHDRGFCPWEDMLASFGDLTSYHQEAIKKTAEIRNRAKELYDKRKHKEMLIKFLTKEISDKSLEYQHSIERNINNSLAYGYKLPYQLEDMLF